MPPAWHQDAEESLYSHPMILPEYLSTFFLAEVPSGGWPQHFHIITAHNPGIIVGVEINVKADEELCKELNLVGSSCFRITGCSPDLKHQEQGWGVAGLSEERAIAIGRQYGQNAIFEVTAGVLSVIGCLSGERISVDKWEQRLHGQGRQIARELERRGVR